MTTTPPIDLQFHRATYPPEIQNLQPYLDAGLTEDQARAAIEERLRATVVRSETHQVEILPVDEIDNMLWLSIKRRSREVIADRRELAVIMRALAPGSYGLELFPAPFRVVDSSNQFHAFIAPAPLEVPEGLEWMTPPHHGKWRDLWLWKEQQRPGQEAALVWGPTDEAPFNGQWMVAPPGAVFPFGFREGLITTEGFMHSVQEPFDEAFLRAVMPHQSGRTDP